MAAIYVNGVKTSCMAIGGGGGSSITEYKYAYFNYVQVLLLTTSSGSSRKFTLNMNSSKKLECKFYQKTIPSGSGNYYIIGNNDYYDTRYLGLRMTSQKLQVNTGSSTWEDILDPMTTGEHTIIINDIDGKILLDGNDTGFTWSYGYDKNPTIGSTGEYASSSTPWDGYFEYLKMYDKTTGDLLNHIVPAELEGHPCLFDKVSKYIFYANQANVGSSSFDLQVMDEIPTT